MSTAAPAPIMPAMLKATLKWALILACLLALGPLIAELVNKIRDVDGGRAVTLLINGDKSAALVAAAGLAIAVIIVGLIMARLYTLTTAMICCGWIVAWAASAEGNLESIVRRAGDGRDLLTLGIEGLLVTAAAGAATTLFARYKPAAASPSASGPNGPLALLTHGDTSRDKPGQIILAGLASGVLVAAACVWLFALSGAHNQTLVSAIVAGIAAGAINHALSAGRSFTLTPLVPILSIAILALLAPILVKFVEGPRLLARIYDGTVLNIARPVSLDWAAGALIGVPLGMSWASASAQKHTAK